MALKVIPNVMLSPFNFVKSVSVEVPEDLYKLRNIVTSHMAANGPTDVDIFTAYFRSIMPLAKKFVKAYSGDNISTVTMFDHILSAKSVVEDACFAGILVLIALANAVFEQPKLAKKYSNIGMGVCSYMEGNVVQFIGKPYGVFRAEFLEVFRCFFNGVRLFLLAAAPEYKAIKAPDTRLQAYEAAVLCFEQCGLRLQQFKYENTVFERAVYYLRLSAEIYWCYYNDDSAIQVYAQSNAWICLESYKQLQASKPAERLISEILGRDMLRQAVAICKKQLCYKSLLNTQSVEQYVNLRVDAFVL